MGIFVGTKYAKKVYVDTTMWTSTVVDQRMSDAKPKHKKSKTF